MDKKGEKGDGKSPRNFAQRSHSLFNNIINLSSSGIRNSPGAPSLNNKIDGPRTTKKEKGGNGNQSPSRSSCSSMSSSGGSNPNANPTPLGPAPRTFSILTALNELSISQVQDSHTQRAKSGITAISPPAPPPIRKSPPVQPFQSEEKVANFTNPPQSQSARSIWNKSHTQNESNSKRTPEWIDQIFQQAKHGRLHQLKECLTGLDSGLMRHLADGKGNTLLQCAVRGGHFSTIQWLITILGPHADAALSDQDSSKRTPILTALKKGHLDCFQWLVQNTNCGRSALLPKNGERSLLHYASRYGNLMAVRWLIQCLADARVNVDIRDSSSAMTPLCEAAKAGHISICHVLILAGANPLYQTELGWRAVDFAIRRGHLECLNYLMMAEAAADAGNEVHLLRKEFQALYHQHHSLRSHFRELLRVGKWLVKERSDLIKNFPSSKSSEEGSHLLESGNGTRFSDLEHKLVLAEQASKHLNTDSVDTCPNDYNFQEMLATAQLRCDNLLAASLAKNDTDSGSESTSESDSSSADDSTYPIKRYPSSKTQNSLRNRKMQPERVLPRNSAKSSIAPWLLPSPSNDSILAQFSPLVSDLDLIDNATTTTALKHNDQTQSEIQEISDSTRKSQSTDARVVANGAKATVLEVKEPSQNSDAIKGTPDLIRESTHRKISTDFQSDNVRCEWGGEKISGGSDETIYSEIKGSSYSSTTFIPYHSLPGEDPPTLPTFFPHKIRPFPSSFCDNPQQLKFSQLPSENAPFFYDGYATAADNTLSSTSNNQNKTTNTTYDESPDDHFDKSKICKVQLHLPPPPPPPTTPIPVQPKLTFPVQVSLNFPENLNMEFTESQDDLFGGNSGGYSCQVSGESVSTSNTPVMQRSFSSFFHSSTTVLFPPNSLNKKGKWGSSSDPTTTSNRLSPPLSEASKTESALAPPPSNASQTSELSKTESANMMMPHSEEQDNSENPDKNSNNENLNGPHHPGPVSHEPPQPSCRIEDNTDTTSTDTANNSKNPTIDPAAHGSSETYKVYKEESKNLQVQCIIRRPLVSGMHKTAVHHVTKSGRRQAKAWYEIEGSDDDEKSLLQKAKSRSSRSSKLSTSSLSESGSEAAEDESETSLEHQPPHNCQDFI